MDKRTEVALFQNGKIVRGVLEHFNANDQALVTSGDANGITSTLNFTNSTGGTFTVSNSALLFNDAFVTSGVLDANTGTITFTNSSGGTFNVTGFEGFTSYWDSTAHNNIIASGDSTTHTMIPGTLGMTGNTFVGGNLQIATDLQHIGDTTTKISFHNDGAQIDFLTENGSRIDINNSGVRLGGANSRVTTILDEDAMGTNSNTALATQQSIKAYVDASHPAESDTLQTVTSRGATSNVAITLSNTLTVGVDDTGHDVKFFGATAGKYMLWDEDQDSLFFPDDTKIVLGTGSDTEIQQTGSETIIKDASTGNIKLRAGTVTIQNGAASKTMGVFNGANSVDLHYNNTKKFETTNTGVNVTGNMVSTGVVQGGKLSNIASPTTALDIHHDPTSLGNNEGGGEVVTFGSASGALTAGKLYYLNTSGVWTLTRANASSSNGNSQLLGIALGTTIDSGILLRGFFDMNSYLTGTFNEGISLYVCETTSGNINVAAPGAANEFIRVVGYATSAAKVIYFNPDGTYITLS